MKAVVTAFVLAISPIAAMAQSSRDSAQIVFEIRSIRSRVSSNTERNEVQRAAALGAAIRGAVVSLQSGLVLGTSDDSGSVAAPSVPVGRHQLNVRAKEYHPLTCRVNVRAGPVDTVRILLVPETRVAVWEMPAGCRQRR